MKNVLLLLWILFGMSALGKAQNDSLKSTICINTGISFISLIVSGNDNNYDSPTPAFQLTYDNKIEKWFSLGGAVSYQSMRSSNLDVYGNYSSGSDGMYSATYNRLNIAMRALFYYVHTGRVDLYSGMRFGYTHWEVKTSSPTMTISRDGWLFHDGYAPQVVLFGVRGYFTNHFGMNCELAAGSPHYFSMGITFRL